MEARVRGELQELVRLWATAAKLTDSAADSPAKVLGVLTRLEQKVNKARTERWLDGLENWILEKKGAVEQKLRQLADAFGWELDSELKSHGLSLSGQYPDLKCWLLTLSVDFQGSKVTLWYGPKVYLLASVPATVSIVAKKILEIKHSLGSGLTPEELIGRIYNAYRRYLVTTDKQQGASIPIMDVLPLVSYEIQNRRFFRDPKPSHFKTYTKADFGYDLCRLREAGTLTVQGWKLKLVTATIGQAERPGQTLWVPNSTHGPVDGTVYSHLAFGEAGS